MINLIKNTFYKEEETKQALCEFIRKSERLSMGPKCKEFEKEFSKYQERKYSVLFNSGSSANLALIQSLLNLELLHKRDNVGVSALTWATNVMPVMQLGLNPIPIDVSLENLNVTSSTLKDGRYDLKALFTTNLLGFSGDLNTIKRICDNKRTILLEDNCESFGSGLDGKKLGNFGLASTFSFFVGHHLSTIEGGMVCTDDADLYRMLTMVRAHGWGRNLEDKSRRKLQRENGISDFNEPYTFYYPGYNLRPTEITGFLGTCQLRYADKICERRFFNFLRFQEAAEQNPDLRMLNVSHMDFVSNFAYPLLFKDEKTMEKYKKKFSGLEIRAIVSGSLIEQPFFKREFSYNLSPPLINYPNAKQVHNLGFYIPNNPDLADGEIKEICNLLK